MSGCHNPYDNGCNCHERMNKLNNVLFELHAKIEDLVGELSKRIHKLEHFVGEDQCYHRKVLLCPCCDKGVMVEGKICHHCRGQGVIEN